MPASKVDLTDAFASFEEPWQPRLAARVDDHAVKLAKLQGEFIWHQHDDADELFLVWRGELSLRFREDPDVVLGPGQLHVVPRGVEHLPVAGPDGCELVMIERADVVNTGSAAGSGRTAPTRPLDQHPTP